MKYSPYKVVVINRLQNNLDISLQQPGLDKKLGFFSIRLVFNWARFPIVIRFYSRALKNKDMLVPLAPSQQIPDDDNIQQ
jgi:hypothetical protein